MDDTLFDHHRATRLSLERVLGDDPAFGGWSTDDLDRAHRELLERFHLEVLAGRLSIDDARVARFERLLDAAGVLDAAERAHVVARAYRQTYETCWHPVAGAVDLVSAIKAAKLSLVIVTNNSVVEQRQKLSRLGLDLFVDQLVTSEELCCSKPEPRIFHEALHRVGANVDAAVMLGDAWATDIEGARAAGVRAVWFNRFGAASPDSSVDEVSSLTPAAQTMRVLLNRSTTLSS